MNGRYLLDTNIIAALFNGDFKVTAWFGKASEVFLASVTLGELLFGAAHSGRPEENAARVDEFAANCQLIKVDAETARHYGQLKAGLRKKGRPIPENDLWIAACALQHGLILATRDRHFQNLEGLNVQAW
jgi:tRNA(fMet)-specific endonuclease VapC